MMKSVASLLAVLAFAGSCREPIRVCSLVGCESGLTVHLASLPSGPFRVEVRPSGAYDVVYVFECTSSANCRQEIFFAGLVSTHVEITVKTGIGSRTTESQFLTYTHFQPNGPECEPDCQRADMTVPVPT
jgi:hypothetical protein